MFHFKSYHKANSVKEAIQLLQSNPRARLIAGGTDVLIRLRDGKKEYQHLVDIHGLEELKPCFVEENGNLVIGSGVTFTQAMSDKVIQKNISLLAVASGTVGGPQIRNVATIGGNICNGVTSADSAGALFALNAVLNIEGPEGTRRVPIADFYLGPGKVDLKDSEILTSFTISPADYKGYHGFYYKYAMRNAMDIATIGCAAVVRIEGDQLEDLRLAFGVAAPVPIRCMQTENRVNGQKLTEDLLREIRNSVSVDVNPRTSWRASKEFRLQIIEELSERVVRAAIENAGGKIN